jgi:hypothetical protein
MSNGRVDVPVCNDHSTRTVGNHPVAVVYVGSVRIGRICNHGCLCGASSERPLDCPKVIATNQLPHSRERQLHQKHEPVSDIDTAAADGLKVLDPKRPIREADIPRRQRDVRFGP